MLIIGIAGGTGSGKTTVMRKIVDNLGEDQVVEIPLDSYYKDSSHLPLEERLVQNFDHPDAFDWPLLRKHISSLRQGQGVDQPIYHYATCSRLKETVRVEPHNVIIIEGILTLWDKGLRDLMDLKVFVDTEADERLIRVIQRDVLERNRTAQDVMDRYLGILKPMHQEFIEPSKAHADLIIPQGGSNEVAIRLLSQFINWYIQKV